MSKKGNILCGVAPRAWLDGYEYLRGIPFTSFQMKAWMKGTGYSQIQSVTTRKTIWIFPFIV